MIIFADGIDIEDPESSLKCAIQYRAPLGSWVDLEGEKFKSDHWEVTFLPTRTDQLGNYDFRVRFTDTDLDKSDWTVIEDAIEVKNNFPKISKSCDNFKVNVHPKNFDLTRYESGSYPSGKTIIFASTYPLSNISMLRYAAFKPASSES